MINKMIMASNIFERFGFVGKTKLQEKDNKIHQLSESLAGQINAIRDRLGKSKWGQQFLTNIYEDTLLQPHDEMHRATKAFMYNAYVYRASKTRANFMTGGEISIVSENQKFQDKVNELIYSTKLSYYINEMGEDLIVNGNTALEKLRKNGKIVKYVHIPRPEYFYVQFNDDGDIEYYVQEIPDSQYGKGQYFNIRYNGDRFRAVRGVRLEKEDVMRLTLGTATISIYGRGAVCTLVNDIEILWEIERAMAVIARYKAIPKKLISLKDKDATSKAVEWLANQMSNLSDFENPISPYQLDVMDLSYSGADLNIQPMLDYLKKKITTPLAPSFLMHGEETNYAVSHDQKSAFELEIRSERNDLCSQLYPYIDELIESWGIKLEKYEIKFGEYDLGEKESNRVFSVNAFNNGIISLDEARAMIGLDADKDKGTKYKYELTSDASSFMDLLGDVDDDISDEVKKLSDADKNRGV